MFKSCIEFLRGKKVPIPLDIRQAFRQINQETLTSFSEHDDVVSYLLEDYTANSIESDEEME